MGSRICCFLKNSCIYNSPVIIKARMTVTLDLKLVWGDNGMLVVKILMKQVLKTHNSCENFATT
jgi:hypothetical protein